MIFNDEYRNNIRHIANPDPLTPEQRKAQYLAEVEAAAQNPKADPVGPSKIFISYRRDDCGGVARSIYKMFRAAGFNESRLFMDLDIHYGARFEVVLGEKLKSSDVLLCVMGPRWLDLLRERAGAQRDFVQLEIEEALKLKMLIVPVLIAGAKMPLEQDLPISIRDLAILNAPSIRDDLSDEHGKSFLEQLQKALEADELNRQGRRDAALRQALLEEVRIFKEKIDSGGAVIPPLPAPPIPVRRLIG